MRLKIVIILLVVVSFATFGWSGAYYRITPTQASAGLSHTLNNHGTIHYLKDSQWHSYVWLNVISGIAFLIAALLNWRYKPFQQPGGDAE